MHFLKKIGRSVVCFLLALILFLQIVYFAFLCGKLDAFLEAKKDYILQKIGVSLVYESCNLGPKACVVVKNGKCTVASRNISIEFKELIIEPKWISLFFKNFKLKRFELSFCDIFMEEIGEVPITIQYAKGFQKANKLYIQSSTVKVDKLQLALYGFYDLSFNRLPSSSFAIKQEYVDVISKIVTGAQEPLGYITFGIDNNGGVLNGFLGAKALGVDNLLYCKNPQVFFKGGSRVDKRHWDIYGTGYDVKYASFGAKDIFLKGKYSSEDLGPQVLVYCNGFSWGQGLDVPFILGDFKNIHTSGVCGSLTGVKNGSWVKLDGKLAMTGEVHAKLRSFINVNDALFGFFRAQYPALQSLQFNFPVFCKGSLCLGKGFVWNSFKGDLGTYNCVLMGIALDEIHSSFFILPDRIALSNFSLTHSDCLVSGSYTHCFNSSNYRFLLEGSLKPVLINGIMDPWWPQLWADFMFFKQWPWASVEVAGNWAHHRIDFVYGLANCHAFSFRGACLDTCSLKFWSKPMYLQLFDVFLGVDKSFANATIDWLYTPASDDNFYAISFDARSSLDLLLLGTILKSQTVLKLNDSFKLTSLPSLSGQGVIYNDLNPISSQMHDVLHIHASIPDPLFYEGVPLDFLSFKAFKEGPSMEVSPLAFGLSRGLVQGKLNILSKADKEHIHLGLHLTGASYDAFSKLKDCLNRFRTSDIDSAPQKNELSAVRIGGIIDVDVEGEGVLGDFNSFSLSGKCKLKDANLGNVRLFGQLSELVGLGNFGFNELKATFSVNQGHLDVSKVSIEGSTARIRGNGIYAIEENTINFYLRFHILGAWKIPLVSPLLKVVDPFSKIFIVHITGSPDDPQWQVKLSPFSKRR